MEIHLIIWASDRICLEQREPQEITILELKIRTPIALDANKLQVQIEKKGKKITVV